MKFDFIIGNPPYQEDVAQVDTKNGQHRSKSIFQYFQIAADKIANDGSCLVYPGGRWIQRSGKGMKDFGEKLINDPKLNSVYFYPNSKELFGAAADLTDGISIVVKDFSKQSASFEYHYIQNGNETVKQLESPGNKIMVLNPADIAVMDKVDSFIEKNNLLILHKAILSQKLFSIESDFVEKNPEKVKPYQKGYHLEANEIKLLTNDKAGKAGRAKWFVANKNVIPKTAQKYLDNWQVIVSSANAGGQKRDNQIEIADNHSAFGRSRVALRSFKTQQEAKNFLAYCKTYLIRYAFLMIDESLTSLAKRVPDLYDYSNGNTIIDFKDNLDKQLFSLAKLDDSEIEYVRKVVDNINNSRK